MPILKNFDITPLSLKPELNPVNNPNGYLGANSALDPAYSQVLIDEYSSYVIDRLPPRYKRLARHVDGEWIFGDLAKIGRARGGETTIQLGLGNVSNVRLYHNYTRRWNERGHGDALDAGTYTVEAETGKITFNNGESPLEKGDTLIAEYDHDDLSNNLTLRRIVKNLVISHLAKELFTDEQKLQNYGTLENQAYVDLGRISEDAGTGRLNLSYFDRLELVSETLNDRNSSVAILNYNSGLR